MKDQFVTYEIALNLKKLGFDEECLGYYTGDNPYEENNDDFNLRYFTKNDIVDDRGGAILAPIYQQVINWFDNKGLYLEITPEFYEEGINWNWQVWWYLPTEEWIKENYFDTTDMFTNEPKRIFFRNKDKFMVGTAMYGDNNEYPVRMDAIKRAIKECIKIESMGRNEYRNREWWKDSHE